MSGKKHCVGARIDHLRKAMVKLLLCGVVPKKLALALNDLGLKKIETMMVQFVAEYQRCVKAKKVLTGMDAPPSVLIQDHQQGR